MVKPIPPIMISSMIVIFTNGSAAYFVNDEYSSFMPIRSKPALQNADIEWNTEKYMPLNMPKSGMKRIAKSTAPMPSIRKVPFIITLKSLTIPPISSALTLSCIRSLCLSPIFLCRSMENATPIEMKPMPPIWISTRITSCPMILQCLKVSNTTRPVTQVALVAVKSESRKLVHCPSLEENGRLSIIAPDNIVRKKPTAMYLNSDRFLCRFFMSCFISFISNPNYLLQNVLLSAYRSCLYISLLLTPLSFATSFMASFLSMPCDS